jgi:Rrf2 family protein
MRTRYALKALAALAERGVGAQRTVIGDLVRDEGMPRKFLEAILRDLSHQGLLNARRGPGGGYSLRVAPEQITVAIVVRSVSRVPSRASCAIAGLPCPACSAGRLCRIGQLFREIEDAATAILEGTTIADLMEDERASALGAATDSPQARGAPLLAATDGATGRHETSAEPLTRRRR